MKILKKAITFLLLLSTLAAFPLPVMASSSDDIWVQGTITWHGGDPTSVHMFVNGCDSDIDGIYRGLTLFDGDPFTHKWNSSLDPDLMVLANTYKGNGEWTLSYRYLCLARQQFAPFVGLSRSTLDGKWYCDKWDFNNLIYQPGQYATTRYIGHGEYVCDANFFLTSSAAHNSKLTINRTFTPGAQVIDTIFDVYREYAFDSGNYQLITSVSMPSISNSVTLNDLYDGNYAVVQRTLLMYYSDDASGTFKNVPKAAKVAVLSNSNGSVSFSNTYVPHYSVIVAPGITGGTIVPNKTEVAQGQTVDITATPNSDKQLKAGSLKYSDASGDHAISGSHFVMPASNVTVSAQFEPRELWKIQMNPSVYGTLTAETSSAKAGDIVHLACTPHSGYYMVPGSLGYTPTGGTFTAIDGMTFAMPASDVAVDCTYSANSEIHIDQGSVTITQPGGYTITGSTSANALVVNGNISGAVNITMQDASIEASGCAFAISSGTTVNLTLKGANTLKGETGAGLRVPEGATLNITSESTGSLNVIGKSGAGIGGDVGENKNCGTVNIDGGFITAKGGMAGAGIGGGMSGNGGAVNISGGTVHATGDFDASGIGGGGVRGNGGVVNISGGTVVATGDYGGAGIGGGAGLVEHTAGGNGGTVTISGGVVTATVGNAFSATGIGGGADIGGGAGNDEDGSPGGNGGTVTITGGTVNANTIAVGGVCYTKGSNGSVFIAGGSIPASITDPVYKNIQRAVRVYRTVVNGLPASTAVTCAVDGGTPVDCSTDVNGKLYPWLPVGRHEVVVNIGNTQYKASDNIAANNNALTAAIYISPIGISTTLLPIGIIGTPYSTSIAASGGEGSYTYSATGLPGGLSLNSATGQITGSPTDAGTFSVGLTVSDGTNTESVNQTLTVYDTLSTSLTGLVVTDGSGNPLTISPDFDRDAVAYSVNTTGTASSFRVTVTLVDAEDSLTIAGQSAISGTTVMVALANGANLIPIVATSPDGLSQRSCILSVNGTVDNADLSVLSLSAGTLNFTPGTTSYTVSVGEGTSNIDITAAASDPKAVMVVDGAILPQGSTRSISLASGNNAVSILVIAQNADTKMYTVNITRQTPLAIGTSVLPAGIIGAPYSAAIAASGGGGSYTYSATGLPGGLSLNSATGQITGTPNDADAGTHTVHITVTDNSDSNLTATRSFSLTVHAGCGNGAYLVVPESDSAYTAGYNDSAIPTMTVNNGVSGLTYFSVGITPVTGHSGNEVCVFVQMRGGQQIGFSAVKGDFDALNAACGAFNVKPGDIIKVYVVDGLANGTNINPVIL